MKIITAKSTSDCIPFLFIVLHDNDTFFIDKDTNLVIVKNGQEFLIKEYDYYTVYEGEDYDEQRIMVEKIKQLVREFDAKSEHFSD